MFDSFFERSVRQASKTLKFCATLFFVAATFLWSVSPLGLLSARPVFAASAVTVSNGTINANFPGALIQASSPATSIAKVSVTASAASKTLTSVQVNFSGSGFATSDLLDLATDDASGVALYNDAGGTPGSFDGTDAVVTLASGPAFSGTNLVLTPATPVALTSGTAVIFHVVIKTAAGITHNDVIDATVPINGVVTSDGNGPTSAFVVNNLRADTAAATIQSVSGFAGSPTLTVKFSKPVQKVGIGNLSFVGAGDPFTYVDGGGGATAQTIVAVQHTAGQDFATVNMSTNLDAEDVDGSPATVAAVYDANSTLVTFEAVGGTSPYSFTANSAGDTTILSNLGLSLATNGKLTGTVANRTGTHQVNIKVTDSTGTPLTSTRLYNINVATSGGAVPAISGLNPAGGAQSASALSITLTGLNTTFTSASPSVSIALPTGASEPNGITVGAVTVNSATSITFPVTIAANARTGPRDVRVTTGSQTVTMPNGFNVFASGASGLTLLLPSDAYTGNPMPPTFQFNPSSHADTTGYLITVATTSSFSTVAWQYIFPKPADAQNSNGSHCSTTNCNLTYGAGNFSIMRQQTALSPDTVYYWKVSTYSGNFISINQDTSVPLETTTVRSFRTTASVLDASAPNIMHRPAFSATASTNLVLFARITDDKTDRK